MILFDTFWELYPRKIAKKSARRAWDKLGWITWPSVIDALRAQLAAGMFDLHSQFIPYPASWLNGAFYEAEVVVRHEAAIKVAIIQVRELTVGAHLSDKDFAAAVFRRLRADGIHCRLEQVLYILELAS
mgnify:CR=1 FL=1